MNPTLTDVMPYHPAVFAMGEVYQILIPLAQEAILRVEVGERRFYDDMCGVLRSSDLIHRVEIPMSILDEAKEYTVVYQRIIDRKAYFPEMEEAVRLSYSFRPLPLDRELKIYHLSDTHNMIDEPVAAAGYFGEETDLLILNGDIPNHAGKTEHLSTIFQLSSAVAKGSIPIICTRGNHDTRGRCAEDFLSYLPRRNGKTYYTLRLGSVWALVLDCGEDKDDDHPEYGGTTCFHPFRLAETEFIRDVVKNAEKEYLAEGVEHRLVICHIPFTYTKGVDPFDIEKELYAEWARLLREEIRPELMICGHRHQTEIWEVGGKMDSYGQACPVIIGSNPHSTEMPERDRFDGCAIVYGDERAEVLFTSEQGEVLARHTLELTTP